MESEQIMAEDVPPGQVTAPHGDAAWDARRLVRAARAATLATTAQGQPFASLVTPATAADLSVLMLLSSLSEHTCAPIPAAPCWSPARPRTRTRRPRRA
jgi:hypothetical protein